MEKSAHLDEIRRRLSALKYARLRKVAKRHSINANQKKEVLITELSRIWEQPNESNKENAVSEKSRECSEREVSMSISLKSPLDDTLNQTFTIDEDSGDRDVTNAEKTLSVPLVSGGIVGKEDILHLSNEMVSIQVNRSNANQNMDVSTCSSARKNKPPAGSLTARFAAIHQKLTEKQPTLHEIDANVKRRFAEHERSVPDTFKRLATPKASKMAEPKAGTGMVASGYKFKNADADPSKMNFSFSKVCAENNNASAMASKSTTVVASQSKIPRPHGLRIPGVDAKELTKKSWAAQLRCSSRVTELSERTNTVTFPQMTSRLQRLATPRGKEPDVSLTGSEKETLRKCGRRYIPRRGRLLPFVDTTKMTDRQFQQAKMSGKIRTLTAVSATNSRREMREQLHATRQKARERVLQARRKC